MKNATSLRGPKLGLIAIALSLTVTSRAQSFTIEQVLDTAFPSELTASAHGEHIAWVMNDKGARNVWVADGPRFYPRQVTHYEGDNGQPIESLRLTPNGDTVVYARGTELDEDGRAANPLSQPNQPLQQVWSVATAGSEPRLLGELGCSGERCEDIQISPNGKYAVWAARGHLWIASLITAGQNTSKSLTDLEGDLLFPNWSPDGTRLAFTVSRGDHAFIAIGTIRNGEMCEIHYVAPSVDRDLQSRWSPDGAYIVFLRLRGKMKKRQIIPVRPNPWSIWIANVKTLEAKEIWKSGDRTSDSFPHLAERCFFYAADNRIIFNSERDGWSHLYSIDAQAGGKPVLLTPGEFDISDVTLSADKQFVLFSSNQDDLDRRHLWLVDTGGRKPQRALTWGKTIEWAPVETGDGKNIICLGSTAISPALVYKINSGIRELLTPNAVPADFPEHQLVVPSQVVFRSRDGYKIHGQLFTPRGKSTPGPAVIFVHGGPYRQMMLGFHPMEYYHNAYAENQYLANLGFTVLSVNYRLGTMYGRNFREAPHTRWRGAAEYQDVLAGAAFLRALPLVDPRRIGIWGGSYGGFLTALALARNSDVFAAGVDFHGVHDWSERVFEWGDDAVSAPDYEEALKLAWASSPDAFVNRWKSPVLLIQGDDDRNVAFSQMVDLIQRLREYHVPFEQIVYPDEIHEFLLYRHFVESYEATAKFLVKQLAKER